MAKRSQTLITGLLILSILVLIRVGWGYIQSPLAQNPLIITESFKTAPTTAATCGCLAGYVPSKLRKSPLRLYVLPERSGLVIAVNDQTKERYSVTSWDACGMGDQMRAAPLQEGVAQLLDNFTDRGPLPCEMQKEFLQGGVEVDTYFCQSLSDPTKTRDCY